MNLAKLTKMTLAFGLLAWANLGWPSVDTGRTYVMKVTGAGPSDRSALNALEGKKEIATWVCETAKGKATYSDIEYRVENAPRGRSSFVHWVNAKTSVSCADFDEALLKDALEATRNSPRKPSGPRP